MKHLPVVSLASVLSLPKKKQEMYIGMEVGLFTTIPTTYGKIEAFNDRTLSVKVSGVKKPLIIDPAKEEIHLLTFQKDYTIMFDNEMEE